MPVLTIAKLAGVAIVALLLLGAAGWVYTKVELAYSEQATIEADNNAINDLKGQVQQAVGLANQNAQAYADEVKQKTAAEGVMNQTNDQLTQLTTVTETLKEKIHATKSTCPTDAKLDAFLDSMRVRDANRASAASSGGVQSSVSGGPIIIRPAGTTVGTQSVGQ